MNAFSTEERLAMLLNALGDDVSRSALQAINPTQANYIQQLLDEFRQDPPSAEEVDYVIKDFNQFFRFALDSMGNELADIEQAESAKKVAAEDSAKGRVNFEKIVPTQNPIDDLKQLDPFQIAMAVVEDHPKTIAMVLRTLSAKQAAKTIEFLPEESRAETIVFLSQESTVPAPIVNQVLKSTVVKANSVECREEEVDQAEALAELMRSLPKQMRVDLMEKLQAHDAELAGKVKTLLYVFDDVLRLEDRDVQKVLGEVETDSLIVGLQRTDEAIVAKLLNNLSKRARESISEEMEYKTGVSDEEIEEARAQLIGTIARLDESGDIKLAE